MTNPINGVGNGAGRTPSVTDRVIQATEGVTVRVRWGSDSLAASGARRSTTSAICRKETTPS